MLEPVLYGTEIRRPNSVPEDSVTGLRLGCAAHIRLKVHKNENFFGFDFEFCTISLLVMSKY